MHYGDFYYLVINTPNLLFQETYTAAVNGRETQVVVTGLKMLPRDGSRESILVEMKIDDTGNGRLTCVGICRIEEKADSTRKRFVAGILKPGVLQTSQPTMMDLIRETHAYWDSAQIYERAHTLSAFRPIHI